MKTCILLLTFAATTIADDSHFSTSWEAFTEPYQLIEVAAPEAGRVAKVHVKRGSRVHAGDVLVELDNSVLQVKRKMAQKRIENRARLEAARVEFEKQQRRYDTLLALSREGAGTPDELREAEVTLPPEPTPVGMLQCPAGVPEQEAGHAQKTIYPRTDYSEPA
jgi:multidrug resistance efflux pump